ncbi:hypothetical protein [Vibrio salinus]|uniref:hypothetical protein n=1 Tax=Vibrio salinus TaxID=2899784 RepID=UPI001E4AE423|nr:hypothetical protein [Vibrio salinus]MCE0496021.1 hypothetical protein [Vibrio salinus]
MTINSIQSGYNLINQSSQMASKAADDINSARTENDQKSTSSQLLPNDIEKKEAASNDEKSKSSSSTNNIDPLIELNKAVQYNKAGTNIVQKNQEMLGSMLDVRV